MPAPQHPYGPLWSTEDIAASLDPAPTDLADLPKPTPQERAAYLARNAVLALVSCSKIGERQAIAYLRAALNRYQWLG